MSDWVNSIGKQLIKSVKIEIPGVFWCQTQKHCNRCKKLFTYKDDLDLKMWRFVGKKEDDVDICNECAVCPLVIK